MNIRSEIQATYRDTFFGTGDLAEAYDVAIDHFADLAGYVPPAKTLDRLLEGALLGRRHVLMGLLGSVPPQDCRRLADPAAQALRLKPQR
jgi:hypothetical protein